MTKRSVYGIALAIIAVYLVLVSVYRWGDGTPPRVTLVEPFTLVGPATPLSFRVEDTGTGIRDITARLVQNRESYTLVQEHFPAREGLSIKSGARNTFEITVVPFGDDTIPRRRGPAQLIIVVHDHSWQGFFEGNVTRLEQDVTVKFHPPRVEMLAAPLPVSQGGAGLLLYRASEDTARHGVQIGDAFFPGYHRPGASFGLFSLFAFPYHLPASTPVTLVADDGLGNRIERRINVTVRPKQWRTRRLKISDRFISQTVLPIIERTPGLQDMDDPLRNFLQVNSMLRRKNTEDLKAIAGHSRHEFLWKGPFRQLSKSRVEAAFADHRQYLYKGHVVDTQDHLGFDLAVTAHYPVEAANAGTVVLAEYFGIYGNTIVIDHGYGLQSLYAHLSSFSVEPGESVRKKHIIGRSGMTGLAAGDHLHFSMLLHGVQVTPLEWWDPRWVRANVSRRLRKNTADAPAPRAAPSSFPATPQRAF